MNTNKRQTRRLSLNAAGTLFAGLLLAAGPAIAESSGSATIDAIKERGQLVCGTSGQTPGFSMWDSQGVLRGLDADSCRAVAAAILGDANKVKFVATTSTNRFTALQSGEIDILVRATTWTLSREANLGLMFAGINYYDGTGFLVQKSSGVKSAKELDGATICVLPGTSTELAVSEYFRINKMKFTPILIEASAELQQAFFSGRCDVWASDSSTLATVRATRPDKDDLVLLPEIISKEPFGYIVRKGDDKFFDLVRWTYFSQLIAEELGISSKNIDSMMDSTKPDVRRLLGLNGDLGKALGVDNKFAYNVVKQVGNFGEIWDRNITALGVPRGINNLWNKGGLQYAPPMR